MNDSESSKRVGSADFTSRTASSYHIDASLANQKHSGTGASKENRGRCQGNSKEEVELQRKGEDDAFKCASTQNYGERSSRSAATLACASGAAPSHALVEGSVHTPQRTSPHAAAALPYSVGPSTRFLASPINNPRPFSSIADGATSNPAPATVSELATASPPPPVVCGVQGREVDVGDSQFGSAIHCRICGIDILRSDWEAHQLAALHQRRLRECATACGSSSSLPAHPLTVVMRDSSMSQPAGAAGVATPQRPAIYGHGRQASSSVKYRARALTPSKGVQHGRRWDNAAVVRRSSRPRRCCRKPNSVSSGTTSSMYSTGSSCSGTASSSSSGSGTRSVRSASAGSSRSWSAASISGATHRPADLRTKSHTTPRRRTELRAASVAPSSSTISFVLLPVSPPCLSATSSASGIARPASAPVKALVPAEAATTVHYIELTEEQQERWRFKELEKELNTYLYRHENKVLSTCLRRWYETMFTKATAPVTDADQPKRRVAAEAVAGASCYSEGCSAARLSSAAERTPCMRFTSPSPSPVSAMTPNSIEAVPYEHGASSAPHICTNREASAAVTDAAHITQNENLHLNRIAVERIDEGDGRSLVRRSNTQQPASVSVSIPDCDGDTQMNRPESAGARLAASIGFVGAPPIHAEHTGMLVTCGEVEPAPAPFLTTCIKSYARVHVAADGRVSPAKVRCGSGDDSAESEAQDLEVLHTKVSWVVRPASRLVPARSTSAESSSSLTGGKGRNSAFRCRAASAGAAAATRRSAYVSSQSPANMPGEEVAWGLTKGESARRCRSSLVQPSLAAESAPRAKSDGRPHPQQPHAPASSSAAVDDGNDYGDCEGGAMAYTVGDGAASEEPAEQLLREPRYRRHRRRHHRRGNAITEESSFQPGKKPRGDDGDKGSEDSSGRLCAPSPRGKGRGGEVHQLSHPAGASGTAVANAAHALIGTGGEDGGRDSVKRADWERHPYMGATGRREGKTPHLPASSDSAATAAVPTPFGGASTDSDKTEGELRESSLPTSASARRTRAAPMRPAEPLCSQSSQAGEIPQQRSLNAPLRRAVSSRGEPSHPTGAPKGDHSSSAFSSSLVALTGASGEFSSSLASSSLSSLSPHSHSIGSDSDIAELVARLSPSTQQRVWQVICSGGAASLLAHSAGAPQVSANVSDAQQLYVPNLTAAKLSAARRPTGAFTERQGRAEAQIEDEEDILRGYPVASAPPTSPPLMPQHVREGGAATATPSMADVLSNVLTGVLGGEGCRTAAAETGERSAAHGLHDRRHHRRPRSARAAVQLPKTLLALHVMSARAASSSIISPPDGELEGHVSDGDGDAAPPPLELPVSFGVDEARAEVERRSSPSGHPYNVSSQMSFGSSREWWSIFSRLSGGQRADEVPHNGSSWGGRGPAGPSPNLGAKLAERESGRGNWESSVAGLLSTERYDEVFSLHACESAKTSTRSVDEGCELQGTDTLEANSTVRKHVNAGVALSSSAVPPKGLGTPRASAPPSSASPAIVSVRSTCAPAGTPSAMQTPPSSLATNVQVESCRVQSSGQELCAHTMVEAQRRSDAVDTSARPAQGSKDKHSEGAAAGEKCLLESVGAASGDADEGQQVGGVAPGASATLHADAALAPNSLPTATGSGLTVAQASAAALVPVRNTPRLYKVVSDVAGAVLPTTNRSPAASSSIASSSDIILALKPADAMEPKSAPAQRHIDPFRGSMRNTDQASEVRPLSLDQHPDTVTLTTIAAIESDGDSSSRRPSLGDSSSGAKPTRDGPQDGFDPSTATKAVRSSSAWCGAAETSSTALVRTTARLSAASWTAVVPCFTTDDADASHYNLPSLEVPVLHVRGERGDLNEGLPQPAWSRHLRNARPGNVPFSGPSVLLSAAKSAAVTPEAFVNLPQLTQDTRPLLPLSIPRLPGPETGIRSCTRPGPREAAALSGVSALATVCAAHTASRLPMNVLPTVHPYCYATLKEAAGEPGSKYGDRIAGSESVTPAMRSSLAASSSLREGLDDTAPKGAFDPSTARAPLSATAVAGRRVGRDSSRRSSSSSHSQVLSARVHPHRRKSPRRYDRDLSAVSPQRRRAERKERRRSRQRSRRDGDASRRHHRHHRHHRSDRQRDEDSNSETLRSQNRRHHHPHEKHRSSRRGRDRPQEEDKDATAAPGAYLPLQRVFQAAPQRGYSDADCRDPRYVAQEADKPLSSGGHPQHPYRLALPSASAASRPLGCGTLARGKDHDAQPTDPFSDGAARAVRQRRSLPRSSSVAPCIRTDTGDDDALSGRLHRRPGERERSRGHRYRGRRVPRASVSSSLSRCTSRSSNVSGGSNSAVAQRGSTRRSRAAAPVGAPPGTSGNVTFSPEKDDILAREAEGLCASKHSGNDSAAHSPETSLRQPMLSRKPPRGGCGAQTTFDRESKLAGEQSRLRRAGADVPENIGPSVNGGAGGGAGSCGPVCEKDAVGKAVDGVDPKPAPELAWRRCPTVQASSAEDANATLLPAVSLASNGASRPTSAPTGSASGRHVPSVQAPCSGAREPRASCYGEVARLCGPSADTATTGTGREQDAAGAQPALPQHGDFFYRDSAGRFRRISDAELPTVLADEAGQRTSPRHAQGPSTSARRPLYVIHNPAPSAPAIAGRQQRRTWTITSPTNSLGCGRLNPYCSSCRAKYNLMFVDPQFRPVQWLSAQSAELDQMGDCRIHSGYIFGGGDTASERDAMLVEQRLRSKRMAAWPELPHSGRDRLIVSKEDLDGPLRQLTPPPQGHFVPIAYEEDTRILVNSALRPRAPLVAAPTRRSFAFSPSSVPLSQLPRRPSPRGVSGDALRFTNSSIRDRVNDYPHASSAHLNPSTIQSCSCSHDSHHRNPQRGCSAPYYQRKQNSLCAAKDVDCASIIQLDKVTDVTIAETGQPSLLSDPALGGVRVLKRMTDINAAASASASAAASGMSAEPASTNTLCQEERRIKKALKQLLWRDLPKQRGSAEWEHYVRSLSEGLRQQPYFALSLPSAVKVKAEEVAQPPLTDGAAES